MKKIAAAIVFLLAVAVVAALAARFSCAMKCGMCPQQQDAHDWIHSHLGLTPQQEAALDNLEKPYREKRRELERQLSVANKDLAEAIRADGGGSERAHAAIARLHCSMGELQMLTVGHVFQMKEVLSPEQYQKLRNFTADALLNINSRHGAE